MFKRILVGIAMVVVVVGAIASRFWRPEVFDACVLLLTLGCAYEVVKQNVLKGHKLFVIPVMVFPLSVFLCYFFATNVLWALVYQMLALLIIVCICVIIEIVYPKTQKGKEEQNAGADTYKEGHLLKRTFRTVGYCVFPSVFLGSLYAINGLGLELGLIALLLVFGVSAFSDTFAFFFGVWLKGPRLCPEISPKKGIIGMVFGFIGGIVASMTIFAIFRFTNILPSIINTMPLAKCVILFILCGLLGSLATQVGDLFESAIKRNLGIKDFSNIFPGHGGLMDRVDGQMFNSVLVLILVLIFI